MLIYFAKKQKGFTVVELMIALAIIAILSSVGVPSYKRFIEQGKFSQAYNNLYNAYRFARSEAIKTSSTMILDAKAGGWANGWVVYPAADQSKILLESPAPQVGVSVSAATMTIKGLGSVSATNVTTFTVVGASKTQKICILQSGQSYTKATGDCP